MRYAQIAAATAALFLLAPVAEAQIGGIAAWAFPRQTLVANLPTPDGTQGLRIVTDDADCDPLTVDDGVVLCLDTGTWELVAGGSGSGVSDHGALTGLADDDHTQYALDADVTSAVSVHAGDAAAHHGWPLVDADIPDALTLDEGSVTAHQEALTITESQISDLAHTPAFVPNADPGVDHPSYVAGHGDGTDCSPGSYARGVDGSGNAQGCTADDIGDDDQTATEVTYTPADGLDWGVDPDDVAEGLDQLALRLTDEEAKADDDVPEAGDFGALALTGDVTSSGVATTLADDVVAAAEMDDADHGQVAWSGGVATVEGVQFGTAFPGSPSAGDVFAVTDDSAAGACDSAAGSALSFCRWSGAAWEALGDGGGGGGANPAGSGSELQYRSDATTFGAVTGSSVSGSDVTLGGVIRGPLGSAAAPTYSSSGDPDTGVFFNGGNRVQFAAGGTMWAQVVPSANFGVLSDYHRAPNSGGAGAIMHGLGLRLQSTASVGWTSGDADSAVNLSLTRAASGTLGISGAVANTPSSQTCTDDTVGASPGALTVTVSGTSLVLVDQQDPDGCLAVLSETGATYGQMLKIKIIANAGGTLDISDTAGVSETAGPFSMADEDSISFTYICDSSATCGTTGRWNEDARSNN